MGKLAFRSFFAPVVIIFACFSPTAAAEKVLRWGVGSQATGVMMFTIHSVAANPA